MLGLVSPSENKTCRCNIFLILYIWIKNLFFIKEFHKLITIFLKKLIRVLIATELDLYIKERTKMIIN